MEQLLRNGIALKSHLFHTTVAVDNNNTDTFINICKLKNILDCIFSGRSLLISLLALIQRASKGMYVLIRASCRICLYRESTLWYYDRCWCKWLWARRSLQNMLITVNEWKQLEASFFFCGLPPFYQKLCGEQRRRDIFLAILV